MNQARVYWSFRSPYSWLAMRRLAAAGARDLFTFIPMWDPGTVMSAPAAAAGITLRYQPMSRAKHLYLLQDVKRLATESGVPLVWPRDITADWDLPHLAFLAARSAGVHWHLYDELVDLRWGQGRTISDPRVLAPVLRACALPGPAQLVQDPSVRAAALTALSAADQDNAFGVPYFKVGFDRFFGLDRLEAFFACAAATTTSIDPQATVPRHVADAVAAFDRDTAGGCG